MLLRQLLADEPALKLFGAPTATREGVEGAVDRFELCGGLLNPGVECVVVVTADFDAEFDDEADIDGGDGLAVDVEAIAAGV